MRKILLLLILALWVSSISYGIDFISDDFVSIDKVVNSTIFAGGSEIVVTAPINGDAFLAGQNITIRASISEDAWLAWNTIVVNGSVQDDLRVAWNAITIWAPVVGDVMMAGSSLSVNDMIWGDLYAWGRVLNLAGVVSGDLNFEWEVLRVFWSWSVLGDVVIWAETQVPEDFAWLVTGTITYSEVSWDRDFGPEQNNEKQSQKKWFHFATFRFISMILLWALALWFMPWYISKASATIKDNPWKTLLTGAWVLAITPFIAIILLATWVWAALGWFILANYLFLWVFLSLFAAVFFANWIVEWWLGEYVGRTVRSKIAIMIVISLLLTLLPYVVSVILGLFGVGAGWINHLSRART